MLTVAVVVSGLAAPARSADVQLNTGSGAPYQVRVKSWWEIPFRSVVRQQYDFSCGSAAVATLLTYHYGHRVSERKSFSAMWQAGNQEAIRKVGFSMLEMKTFLEQIGYRVEGYQLTPAQLARLDRPSIVLLDQNGYKHFVVVKGVRGKAVMLGDPSLGLKEYSLEAFSKAWNGIALAIVSGSGEKPIYNSPRDWDPWARAPIAGYSSPETAATISTHLPPIYQVTPEILVNTTAGF